MNKNAPQINYAVPFEIMMKAFRETIEVVNKYIIDYWVEGGTLLGIMRENRFLPWEHDIDIYTWSDNINNKVRKQVLKAMKEKGFRGYFKVDKATFRREGVKIDILFIEKVGDKGVRIIANPTSKFFWRVRRASLIFASSPHDLPFYIHKILEWVIWRLGCKKVEMTIPQEYFLSTVKYNFRGIEIRIPGDAEGDLRFRYGESWRIPKKDWDSYTDDGAFK